MILRDAIVYEDRTAELFWSVENSLNEDYSIELVPVNDNGQDYGESDPVHFSGERPMTEWQRGEVVFDPVALSGTIADGDYTVEVYVFDREGNIVETESGEESVRIGQIRVDNA